MYDIETHQKKNIDLYQHIKAQLHQWEFAATNKLAFYIQTIVLKN
tara:strand:- start:2890 stop:3024 length:135 start_codon:yes stop_codon:yes gene_type:complete